MKNNKKNIILLIDTSSNEYITVGLGIDKKVYKIKQKITIQKAQVVLPLINKLLKKHMLKSSNISAIQVNHGPGSFTGLRVGIAIANALSYALKISVNNKQIGDFVEPLY